MQTDPNTHDSETGSDQLGEFICDRCEGSKFRDTLIHNGRSVRRDCVTCNRTVGFPVWYFKESSES